MKHVRQPKPSNLCGQACVAMILGISLDEAIERMKTRGGTRTKQLVKVLRDSGKVTCNGKLSRVRKDFKPPKCAVMKMCWKEGTRRRSHWVVWNEGWWYDPSDTIVRKATEGLMAPSDAKLTSYLEIVFRDASAERSNFPGFW